MAAQGRSEQQSGQTPFLGVGLPRSLASRVAASFPTLDALLRGMLAAGQGIQAICLYLGLTRMALDEHLVRLGLPTPHDRAPRSAGKRPWSLLDTVRLMAWRTAAVHPETIALRLGRSVGSVRSKSRRLGVPTPPRKDLVRLDPAALPEVKPDWWRSGISIGHLTSAAKCGSAAGTASVSGSAPAAFVKRPSPTHASAATARASASLQPQAPGQGAAPPLFRNALPEAARPACRIAQDARPAEPAHATQLEIQLPRLMPESAATEPAAAAEREPSAVPETEEAVDFGGDLTWIGHLGDLLQRNKVAVFVIGMLFLGGLHWIEVSKRIDIRPSALKDMRRRLGIPICDREKITRTFEPVLARATREDSGYVVKRCTNSGVYFWGVRGDGVSLCPEVRRRLGFRGRDGRSRSPWVNVLTWADLAEMERPARHSQRPSG